jgi:hypothetical protein
MLVAVLQCLKSSGGIDQQIAEAESLVKLIPAEDVGREWADEELSELRFSLERVENLCQWHGDEYV